MQGPLTPTDALAAMAALEGELHGVLDVAPPTPQLPGLVRHNPGLAAQLLLRLAGLPEVTCDTPRAPSQLERHASCSTMLRLRAW